MKTLSIAQAQDLLTSIAQSNRTTIIGIEAETNYGKYLYAGKGGSRKAVDKMVALEGVAPTDFTKVEKRTVLISSKSYIELMRSLANKELESLKTDLQLSTDDVDTQLKIADLIESKKALNENVEAKARKNGTTLNGIIGLSSKDEAPMLRTYYASKSTPTKKYFLNGEEIDFKGKWAEYKKPYKASKPSSTCVELGIEKEPFPLRDYRLENVRKLTIDGETYTIV
jgi:hypothetical protein